MCVCSALCVEALCDEMMWTNDVDVRSMMFSFSRDVLLYETVPPRRKKEKVVRVSDGLAVFFGGGKNKKNTRARQHQKTKATGRVC